MYLSGQQPESVQLALQRMRRFRVQWHEGQYVDKAGRGMVSRNTVFFTTALEFALCLHQPLRPDRGMIFLLSACSAVLLGTSSTF